MINKIERKEKEMLNKFADILGLDEEFNEA